MNWLHKNRYFVICLLFGIISTVIYLVKLFSQSVNEIQIYDDIKSHFLIEETICEKEVSKVVNYIENEKLVFFTSLGTNYKHPILVFKDQKLIVWSSTKIPTFTDNINLNKSSSFYNERDEKFICKLKSCVIGKNKYTVVGLIPLVKKYKIQNDFLKTEYNPSIFEFKDFSGNFFEYKSSKDYANFFSYDNTFLFSLNLQEHLIHNDEVFQWLLFFSVTFTFLFLLIHASIWLNSIINQVRLLWQLFIWITWVLGIRIVLIFIKYPVFLKNFKVFQSKYFINFYWCQSLGDFFLHSLSLAIILIICFVKVRKPLSFFLNSPKPLKYSIAILLTFFSHFLYKIFFEAICIVNSSAEYDINILQNIHINSFKIIAWCIYLTLSVVFFLVFQIVCKIYSDLLFINKKHSFFGALVIIAVCSVLYLFCLNFVDSPNYFLWFLGSFHFFILYALGFYNRIRRLDYSLYIYLLFSISVSAAIGSWAITETENIKDIQQKNLYTTKLMLENDLYGEYLLQEASDKIKVDPYVLNAFLPQNQNFIEQKIKNVYIGRYLDKYEFNVSFFSDSGKSFDTRNSDNYQDVVLKYQKSSFKTNYHDVYFVNSKSLARKYICFLELENLGKKIGYIVLEFSYKKIMSKSVYPTLLLDKRFSPNFAFPNYSYATYSNDSLLLSSGTFIYPNHFLDKLNASKFENKQNGVINNYKHYFSCVNQKCIVVSSPDNDLDILISNFSFLFIIQLFVVLITVAYYFVYVSVTKQLLHYSTKIQIYLNIAFILPLVVVTFVFMFITIKNYNDDLKSSFSSLALKVSSRLAEQIDEHKNAKIQLVKLKSIFTDLSQNFDIDINLYNNKGKILNSSQPHVFEDKIISRCINPVAYSEIIEKKKKTLVLNENLGDFNYYNVYTNLKSTKSGLVYGIVSIPFYETKIEIQKKLINVIVSIFNIFVIVFMIFVVVSHYIAKTITFPIEQLKVNMKNVSLQKENEMIHWSSKDEIGQLIDEYNKMIVKLKESKEQLTKTEKETAWREMAKQVAHEIKNPLTPMKLNLQYLNHMIQNNAEPEMIEKATHNSIKLLLEQIETLSEIATSFSNFAKMPSPKLENYNVVEVVKSIYNLHASDTSINISFNSEVDSLNSLGDKDLMGRIVNNLIINGKQSVLADKKPVIDLQILKQKETILIKVKDNGAGIPVDIQNKVFLPNFSTKYAGSGIGLAMAKQGIEFFGGKIYFNTEIGKGTTFFIELPVA